MKCKHCNHEAPDLPELRTHCQGQHPDKWRELSINLERFDHDHHIDLQNVCPICPHKKSYATKPTT